MWSPQAFFAVVLPVSFGACSRAAPRTTVPVSAPGHEAFAGFPANAPPPRDDGRLPATAVPERYSLALRIDPTQERFSGTTTISVVVTDPTSFIVLNGSSLHCTRAVARTGSTEIPGATFQRRAHDANDEGELVLSFDQRLPSGKATIEISYDAPFALDLLGLYRVREAGRWYAYTQFEPTHARRAFPCFDEPGFKTPYEVRITTPRGTLALGNSPESSTTDGPDGLVEHTFQPTPPLPSYLVAFAVGDFDFAEGQKAPFAIRVATTKGRASLAALALDDAEGLVTKLGEYFDLPYPYAKLDLLAVPDFAAGAMENPGLITFRDSLLLVDPQRATTSIKRSQAEVIAHELAHQWVGDLVTLKWWNDTWLNEGFATWAEAKVVDQWKPAFGATIQQIAAVQGVMDLDALRSARAVREPVRSTGDASEAFDGLTYDKGAAVLRMLEGWLGPDTFRHGVQYFLHENAWKNAGADDLFKALDYVSALHVGQLASAFLDQPGVPEVIASWTCGGIGAGKIELRESEWRPLGEPQTGAQRHWTLPVCITSGGEKTSSCFTLGAEPITRSFGGGCPAWVYPNADQAGYYRFLVEPSKLASLVAARRSLNVADRIGLVSNAWAGVRQGAIAPRALLDMLPAFDAETARLVVEQIVGVLAGLEQTLVDNQDLPDFRKYVSARLLEKKRSLSWEASDPTVDEDRALERQTVLWAMGTLAYDERILAECERYALAWIRDPTRVSGDVAAVAVPLASIHAGHARLAELRATARTAGTPQDRILAITAMGMFDDASVLRDALDLTLTGELRLSELRYVFGNAQSRRATRGVTYAWVKENWAKLKARLPPMALRGLSAIAGTVCTPAERDDARTFFTAAMRGIDGAKRGLDEALERADLCVELRRYGAAEMTTYFARR
jgi:aminopeptidase N